MVHHTDGLLDTAWHVLIERSSAATPSQVLESRRRANELDAQWRNYLEFFFAGVVCLGSFAYFFAEIRARLSPTSKRHASLQRIVNLFKRTTLLSFKVPVISSRVYAPIFGLWCVVVGFMTAGFLVQTESLDLRLIAARSGQLAAASYPPLFLLSMKNSPIGLLVGSSHEKMNILHRWTGRTVVDAVIVHMVTYIISAIRKGTLHDLTLAVNIYGIAALGAMLLLAAASISAARRRNYEVFYVLHWIFAIMTLGFTYVHFPDTINYVLASVAIIMSDLSLRIVRVLLASPYALAELANINDELVTVTVPLPKFGPLQAWVPGSHAFINVPSVTSAHQHHPFTICSIPEDGYIRFVIKKQAGFTSLLHKREVGSVRCLIDGPYGSLEKTRFAHYPHVLLIGGGVGITFILPILKSLLVRGGAVQTIAFIWSTNNASTFSYFERELREVLEAHERSSSDITLRITLAFTRGNSAFASMRSSVSCASSESQISELTTTSPLESVFEKSMLARDRRTSSFDVVLSRMSLSAVIQAEVDDCDRIAIGACGPNNLIRHVKKSVSDELFRSTKDIFLYTEEFEW